MAKVSLYSILKKCSEQKNKPERIAALQYNQSEAMKAVLQYMFHPAVKFLLPEGTPPYTPSPFETSSRLFGEIRKLNYFVENGSPNLKQIQRERLFIELLETVDPEDALLLIHLKDKKSPFKGLTEDVVVAAFPELFPT